MKLSIHIDAFAKPAPILIKLLSGTMKALPTKGKIIVVILCASGKNNYAGCMSEENAGKVKFVTDPKMRRLTHRSSINAPMILRPLGSPGEKSSKNTTANMNATVPATHLNWFPHTNSTNLEPPIRIFTGNSLTSLALQMSLSCLRAGDLYPLAS